MQLRHSHVILDTCCILNFCASGHFLDILKSIPAIVTVSDVVKTQELLTLKRVEGGESEGPSQFEQAIAKNLLTVVDFESDAEMETFIYYTAEMGDDGESATSAIAFHRNWAIATDDKKAIKVLQKEAPLIQIVTTPDIIKHWSETTSLKAAELRKALQSIRITGKYMPPRQHPLLQWWQQTMSAE
ncbi:MAG: hypothetical protein F6K30_21990 [Cyanothece sp. SIO2G6]|nr:hypothetical protein [Cyanothece sp. SIO2G6]